MNRCLCPGCAARGSCWYKSHTWRRTAELVRRGASCYVVNCPDPVKAADHVEPVHPRMTWSQFISRSNLRPSCRRHNTARGVAARLERETLDGVEPTRRNNPLTVTRSIFTPSPGRIR